MNAKWSSSPPLIERNDLRAVYVEHDIRHKNQNWPFSNTALSHQVINMKGTSANKVTLHFSKKKVLQQLTDFVGSSIRQMLQPRSLRFGCSSNPCSIHMISLIKVTRSYSRWIEVTSSVKWSSILPEGLTSVPSTDSDMVEHGDRLTWIMTCTVDQFEVDEQMSLIKRVLCLTIISSLTPQSHEDCYQNGKQIMWYLIT